VLAIVLAAETENVSAQRLCLGAIQRSKFNPNFRSTGTPRFYGLFGFTETQWKETRLAMGLPWQVALTGDIMDPQGQASAAAWLVARGQRLRGDPNA
jgi:hypothetical protein